MVADNSTQTRDAHRLLAFIYFTFAEADASWQNEETVALYDMLERHAGGLSRDEVVSLAQDAYRRYLALPDAEARLGVIEAEAAALAHFGRREREQILSDLGTLARADGKISRAEGATFRRIHDALDAAELHDHDHDHAHDHGHHHHSRDEHVRLLAFIFFTLVDADGRWQNEETFALYDLLEREAGPGERAHTVELAQAAYSTLLATEGTAARLAWIAAHVGHFHHHNEAERKQVLRGIVELARADGQFTPAEGHVLAEIRTLLLGESHLGAG